MRQYTLNFNIHRHFILKFFIHKWNEKEKMAIKKERNDHSINKLHAV